MPRVKGKTLVFVVDDDHADMIVAILKKIYERTGIPSDAIMKITGRIGGGNQKRVLEAVRLFKNEDIAADIISFIRRSALGAVLLSSEERINQAVDKLRKNHSFTKMQLDWLA